MRQKKAGYIVLAAVGLIILAMIVVIVMGNGPGEKQDHTLHTEVTTAPKEDNGENGNAKNGSVDAAPIENGKDVGNNGKKSDSTVNKEQRREKDSTVNKDKGQDVSNKKDMTEKDEKTDSWNKQKENPTDTDQNPSHRTGSDKQNDEAADDTEPQDSTATDNGQGKGIELPLVPVK